MRSILFGTMALVLGLFTTTALFAYTFKNANIKLAGGYVYFDDSNFNPETQWQNINAWKTMPSNPSCSAPAETLCRVELEPGQEMKDFLESVEELTYEELLELGQIDLKAE